MNKIFIAIVIFLFLVGGSMTSYAENKIVERSIGELVVSHDEKFSYQNDNNPFGSSILYDEFVKIFDRNIKSLTKKDKVVFLWAVMWHLDFDGHSMAAFQGLVMRECPDEFITKLKKYIKIETQLNRNKTRLYLSKKVLLGLNLILDKK